MTVERKHIARNVIGRSWKEKYYGVQLVSASPDGATLAASEDTLAFCWESGGGGTVAVLSTSQLNERKPNMSFFRGHTGAVQDIQFCPFYSTIFATASEGKDYTGFTSHVADTTIKIWDCGNTFADLEPRQDAVATLKGHDKRVCQTAFNDIAEWVLASSSIDGTFRVWDVEVQKDVIIRDFANYPVSFHWSPDCSMVALMTKNRELAIIDPRNPSDNLTLVSAHDGAKPSKVDWCSGSRCIGDHYVVTSGFSKSAERQLRLWDTRNLKTYVCHEDIDRGSAVLQPYIDSGTGLLVLQGKGNRHILFYGIEQTGFIKFGEFEQLEPWKDFAIAPKRCVDVMNCEILRCYGSLGSNIQPVSLHVPRRNTGFFQEELFPPCLSGEASMTSEDWFSGRKGQPQVASMAPVDGTSPFAAKRPRSMGGLNFSRDAAPVRGTSSVLKKRLSHSTHTSEGLLLRIKDIENELHRKDEIIRAQREEIKALQKAVETPRSSRDQNLNRSFKSDNSYQSYATNEIIELLSALADETNGNSKKIKELQAIVASANQDSTSDVKIIVKVLMETIVQYQRRYQRLLQRNESLESVYESLRKI